jgi:DNA-binding beta-propeller fold protein YncE
MTQISVSGSPLGIAVNPVTGMIYVAQYFGPGVVVIDGNTDEVVATITLQQLEPMWVAVDPQANLIYVTTYFGILVVIDGSTNQVVATAVTNGADGAALNPGLARFYTCDYFTNAVDVLDTTDDAVLGSVRVGAGPFALAVDTSSNRIFTANLDAGTVTILQDS